MNVELRAVEPGDEPFLCRLYASTRDEEMGLVVWSEEEKERFLRMQFSAQDRFYREHYPGAELRIVLADGEPAGRLYVDRWPEEIRLIDVSLLPEHRNRGIGTRLLEELLEQADAARVPVTIHVEVFNPARKLYERLGFRVAEDRGVYLLMSRPPARYPKTAS